MIRRIEFEGHSADIDTSAGWLFIYRSNFGHDILPDIMPIIESGLETIASLLNDSDGELSIKTISEGFGNGMFNDFFIRMSGMEMVTVYQIFWAMAKKADKTIKPIDEYFDQFDVFPLDVIIPEVFSGIIESSISSKNVQSLLTKKEQIKASI